MNDKAGDGVWCERRHSISYQNARLKGRLVREKKMQHSECKTALSIRRNYFPWKKKRRESTFSPHLIGSIWIVSVVFRSFNWAIEFTNWLFERYINIFFYASEKGWEVQNKGWKIAKFKCYFMWIPFIFFFFEWNSFCLDLNINSLLVLLKAHTQAKKKKINCVPQKFKLIKLLHLKKAYFCTNVEQKSECKSRNLMQPKHEVIRKKIEEKKKIETIGEATTKKFAMHRCVPLCIITFNVWC